jgi:predicted porin
MSILPRLPSRALALVALPLLFPIAARGQDAEPADSTGRNSNFLEGFRLYGSLRGQVVSYEKSWELQGNASRVGFRLTRDFFDSGIQVFGQYELGIQLIDNSARFSVRGNQGGLGILEFGSKNDPVFTRLGFVGLDFGTYGILTAGKQWSTYYDVSGYTDNFFVFGGQASGTYPLGSDGGGIGTGRADKALTYRVRLGGLTIGAQTQLEANRLTGLGSLGGSLQYGFPFGLTLGVAGHLGDVPNEIVDRVLGAETEETAVVFGAKLERPRLFLAANYSIQDAHDLRNVGQSDDLATVVFDASGFEAFGYYDMSRRFRVSGGVNWLDPDPIEPMHPEFRTRNYVLGGAFYFNSQSLIYAEWKIEDSVDQNGEAVPSVLSVGIRLDFGLPEMQRNDAPPLRFPESTGEGKRGGTTDD